MTMKATWQGDPQVLPIGAEVVVLATDDPMPRASDLEPPGPVSAWVRYWPGDYPMYRSCDLSDLDIPEAPA